MEGLGSEVPNSWVPVSDLPRDEVLHQGPGVLGEAGNEDADLEVGVGALPHSKVVSRGEDVNPVGEGSLQTKQIKKIYSVDFVGWFSCC